VNYLGSLDIASLTDKMLTLKLTMLLAITSAARAHEICLLNLEYSVKHESFFVFQFAQVTKTTKKGKCRPPIKYFAFSNKNLCVCKHLKAYLR